MRPTQKDIADFSEAQRRIIDLMSDGGWHSATEVISTTGQREGLRRLRSLRKDFDVSIRRNGESREFEYRMIKSVEPGTQMTLFSQHGTL